jgi:dipicolinate synthase subunit B
MNQETLKGKKIGFGITASFCTVLEVLAPLQQLRDLGADIYPVVSDHVNRYGSRFHNRDVFMGQVADICGRDVITTIAGAEAFGPETPMDLMIVAPATGNTIAKLASGISDGPVTLAAKATLRNEQPLLLALFSNDALGANGVNVMKLCNTTHVYFVPFGQDNPVKKPKSMTADLSLLVDAAGAALAGKQVQPMVVGAVRLAMGASG